MKFSELSNLIDERNPGVDGPATPWCRTKPNDAPTLYKTIVNGKIKAEGEPSEACRDLATAMRRFWNGWQELVPDGAPVVWRSRPALVTSPDGHRIRARFVIGELEDGDVAEGHHQQDLPEGSVGPA